VLVCKSVPTRRSALRCFAPDVGCRPAIDPTVVGSTRSSGRHNSPAQSIQLGCLEHALAAHCYQCCTTAESSLQAFFSLDLMNVLSFPHSSMPLLDFFQIQGQAQAGTRYQLPAIAYLGCCPWFLNARSMENFLFVILFVESQIFSASLSSRSAVVLAPIFV